MRAVNLPGPPRLPVLSPTRIAPAPLITLSWVVRLRWAAVIGQLLTVAVVRLGLGIALPIAPLVGVVLMTAGSNVLLQRRLVAPNAPSSSVVAAVLVFDTLLLTAMLYFTGGPMNPFSVLYLLHVTLAVMVLGTRWGFAIVGVSAACFGLLYARSVPLSDLSFPPGTDLESLHLLGTWLAYLVAAVFIAYFLGRIAGELQKRDEQLKAIQTQVARDEKLASLSTLAAGAAHELGTPLATIAVVARELEREASRLGSESFEDDARLIRREVDRCRTILLQMSARAGETAGEVPGPLDLPGLVSDLRATLKPALSSRLVVDLPAAGAGSVVAPRQALVLVLSSLVRNAFDASAPGAEVHLIVERSEGEARIRVKDRGEGMSPAVLARAGEPFFTTKEEGAGTGLGLFLAKAFAERLGGRLDIESAAGAGTSATITLPQGRTNPASRSQT